ncbi:neuropeptide-like protein 31 [Diachasma alloeum]|uniref:neuropeptide-like protein 31 n=1 Tax=Diachasma alloeum TaxID=454923 RepID=UPI0007383628|nr:neuropeptide-like protein 31 [Diachasma alloeum]
MGGKNMKLLLMVCVIVVALVATVQSQGYGRREYGGNDYGRYDGYGRNGYGRDDGYGGNGYGRGNSYGGNGYEQGYGVPGPGSPSFTLML